MNSVRPIPRRLLPDNATVFPLLPNGHFGTPRQLRHVRFDGVCKAVDDEHRADATSGKVFIDRMNTVGAYQVQPGSKIVIGGISMKVASVTRLEGPNKRVHHWELEVQ